MPCGASVGGLGLARARAIDLTCPAWRQRRQRRHASRHGARPTVLCNNGWGHQAYAFCWITWHWASKWNQTRRRLARNLMGKDLGLLPRCLLHPFTERSCCPLPATAMRRSRPARRTGCTAAAAAATLAQIDTSSAQQAPMERGCRPHPPSTSEFRQPLPRA